MKTVLSLVVGFFLLAANHLHAQNAQQLTSEGTRAYMSGNVELAKTRFKQALELDPNNVAAKNYLRTIVTEEAKSGKGSQLEKQLQAVVLPKVEFREASVRAALDSLKQQAAKQNVSINFVLQIPADTEDKPVSLSLANVPFTEALRYLCDANSAKFVVEKYAVVIKPAGVPTTASAGAAAPEAAQ